MRVMTIIMSFLLLSCARVDVRTPEPIQINMRIDVYQHVVKEVGSIEDQIYGEQDTEKLNKTFKASGYVYAAEIDEEQLQQIVSRRKQRGSTIERYMSKGYVGENREALLVVRVDVPSSQRGQIEQTVREENSDRQAMYSLLAKKNEVALSEIKKVVFQDHYNRAVSGWWFEAYENGKYSWKQK